MKENTKKLIGETWDAIVDDAKESFEFEVSDFDALAAKIMSFIITFIVLGCIITFTGKFGAVVAFGIFIYGMWNIAKKFVKEN